MRTNVLLPIFFFWVIGLWNVDGNTDALDSKTDDKNNWTSVTDEVLSYVQSPWFTKFIPSLYTVVFFLSLPFNITAIMILLFRIQLKTPAVVFMLNLAVSDVLLVTVLPFKIVYRFLGNNWVIGEGMCRFVTAAFYWNMYCSILLMTSISVDRFLAVVYPMQSLLWRTVSRAWHICLFIWVVSIAGTVPLLVSKLTSPIVQLNITACYDTLGHKDVERYYFHYFTAYITIFFLLPFIVTTFCYVATIRSLSSTTIESAFKRSRSVLLCITVLSEYVVCFCPANIIFLINYLNVEKSFGDSVYLAYGVLVSISSISCCLDPFIYYYGSSRFKKHVYSLMCCDKTKQTNSCSGTTCVETSARSL